MQCQCDVWKAWTTCMDINSTSLEIYLCCGLVIEVAFPICSFIKCAEEKINGVIVAAGVGWVLMFHFCR